MPSPSMRLLIHTLRRRNIFLRKEKRIAPSTNPRQIMHHQLHFSLLQLHLSPKFPVPIPVIRAKLSLQRNSIDQQLEPFRVMTRNPVFGTHPHFVFAGSFDRHYGTGVSDRDTVSRGRGDRVSP